MSKYVRKTKDEYKILGNCGYGWHVECYCTTRAEAKATLNDYRANVKYPVVMKKYRIPIKESGEMK